MGPLKIGIGIPQGADFNLLIQISGGSPSAPLDITGYQFLGEMRETTADTEPVAEFTFTIQNQSANKGQVLWSLPSATVDEIVISTANSLGDQRLQTRFLFDVKMKDTSGNITRVIEGYALVSPQATEEVFT